MGDFPYATARGRAEATKDRRKRASADELARLCEANARLTQERDEARNEQCAQLKAVVEQRDGLRASVDALRVETQEWRDMVLPAEAEVARLSRGCETCRHNDYGDCALTLHVETSDQGTRFESWTPCERLGHRCGAWEAK